MEEQAVKKKRKRRKKGKATPPSFPVTALSDLQGIRLFRDIPASDLAFFEGKVRRASAEKNEAIIEFETNTEMFHYFFFISKGQVKIVGFDEEARKRPLNFLRKGEFFVDKAISWRGMVSTKAVAITDAEIFIIHKDHLKGFIQQYPAFEKRLKTISDRIDYRNRLYCEDSYSRSVLDFLVDTALTQASRIKITQMDKCIECDTCYDSCEDRHGFQRISRGYARFGVLDIAKSCLTCFYPTCIPSCPVDSVVFDSKTSEVQILDDCIGCQACARACQYGAIRMHKVVESDQRFSRFLAEDRKVKPKFIADKCNHCHGFDDLACVSNCPTGAIIEIGATELLENPTLFGVSEDSQQPIIGKLEDSFLVKFLRPIYLFLISFITGLLIFETFALKKNADLSVLLLLQNKGFIPNTFSLSFGRGSDLCIFLGNLGFSLIVLAMIYPLRKAFPRLFRNLGNKILWLDFHNFAGFLGCVLVMFHTGFEFRLQSGAIFGTVGFITLSFVMITGMFGRFLYQVIPRGVAGTELRFKDIEEEDRDLNRRLDAIFEGSNKHKAIIDKIVAATTQGATDNPSLWGLFKSIIVTQYLMWKVRFELPPELKQYKRYFGTFFKLMKEKVRLKRNAAFYQFSSRLFIKWQYVHKPVAYVMGVLAIIHVIYNLFFFSWNS